MDLIHLVRVPKSALIPYCAMPPCLMHVNHEPMNGNDSQPRSRRTDEAASEQLSPPKRVPAYSASRINTKGRTDERERDDVPQPTPLCFARTRVRCRRSIRAQGRYVAVAVLITLQRGAAIPSKDGCITALRLRRNHGPTASACSRHSTCRNAAALQRRFFLCCASLRRAM